MRMSMESAALVKGGRTFPWGELYVESGSSSPSSSVQVEILGQKQAAASGAGRS